MHEREKVWHDTKRQLEMQLEAIAKNAPKSVSDGQKATSSPRQTLMKEIRQVSNSSVPTLTDIKTSASNLRKTRRHSVPHTIDETKAHSEKQRSFTADEVMKSTQKLRSLLSRSTGEKSKENDVQQTGSIK